MYVTRKTLRGASLLLFVALFLAGCENILDVDNPNSLTESDLDSPASATALANGALATVADAYSSMYAPYATTSDELYWTGSRDAWNDLDKGFVSNPLNEFTDAIFPTVGRARFTADLAIERLTEFNNNGSLTDKNDLVVALKSGALIYLLIGDMYEEFPVASRRTEAAAPVPASNMGQLYDTAIGYLDKALALAAGNAASEAELLAIRARAKHGKAVWAMLNPPGTTPANPLVNDAGAKADAQAALAKAGGTDKRYTLDFTATSVGNYIASWVNQRNEMKVDPVFATYSSTCAFTGGLNDPVSGQLDPRARALVQAFVGPDCKDRFSAIAFTSTREMNLILAEAALAAGNAVEAVTFINAVRTPHGVPAYNPAAPGALSVRKQLEYERQANLFMFGRRLHDLYRFGLKANRWVAESDASKQPGIVFPIAEIERRANPKVGG